MTDDDRRPIDLGDVVHATGVGVLALDPSGRIAACNERAAALVGRRPEELVGRTAHDVLHGGDERGPCPFDTALTAVGIVESEADDFHAADGTVVPVGWLSSPLQDRRGVAVVIRSTATERARAAAEAAVTARRRADLDAARRAVAALQRLATITEALADTTTGERELLRRFARVAAGPLADVVIVDLIDAAGRLHRVGGAAAGGLDIDLDAVIDDPDVADQLPVHSPSVRTILRGEVVHLDATTMADPGVLGDSSRRLLSLLRASSALLAPLVVRGTVVGAIGLVRLAHNPPFDAADAVLAGDVARHAALAVDNARLFREQREIAVSLQTALLPATTSGLLVQSASRYLPASGVHRVGGDWYDLFAAPDAGDVVTLIIGDVAGHDIPAATTMAALRNLLRGIAVATRYSCSGIVEAVDANLPNLGIRGTASAVMMTAEPLDELRWELTWTNAGHLAPLLFLPDGTVELLDGVHGPLLGTGARQARGESARTVPAGSTVVLYTDGLIERRSEPIDQAVARLQAVARSLIALRGHPDALLDALLERTERDGGDDIAVLACHLPPVPAG